MYITQNVLECLNSDVAILSLCVCVCVCVRVRVRARVRVREKCILGLYRVGVKL